MIKIEYKFFIKTINLRFLKKEISYIIKILKIFFKKLIIIKQLLILPVLVKKRTILKSPFVHKKARDQIQLKKYKVFIKILLQNDNTNFIQCIYLLNLITLNLKTITLEIKKKIKIFY